MSDEAERAETEREQEMSDPAEWSVGKLLYWFDEYAQGSANPAIREVARRFRRLRSERDRLVEAVEERIEEFEEAAERLHEGYGRDDLPGTRIHQHGRRVAYEEVAISLRDALEAVEGDGEEEKYETFGQSDNLLDDPIWHRIEVGDRVVEFQVPAGASIPFRIPAASDSEDQGTGDGYGVDGWWRECHDCGEVMRVYPSDPPVCGDCGSRNVTDDPYADAAPQDADADGKVGGEKPLWRRLLALAYNMRNTDYNEIEWGHLDDTAEMLESAARRLRRGGGESGADLDPYDWYLVARDDDCACGHEFSMHTSHGCLSCDCGVEIMYGWACADRLRDAPSEEGGRTKRFVCERCGEDFQSSDADGWPTLCPDCRPEERPGGSGERGEQYEGQGFTAGECIAGALGEIHRWRRGAAGSTYDPLDHIEGRLRQALDRLRRSTPDAGEVRCRKCGSTDVATAWKPEVESTIDRGYKGCRNKDEHLHRTCRECRYTWDDPPTDHPAPDEGESDE